MFVIELMKDSNPKNPNVELTKALIANAQKAGLVLLACGFNGNVIRFLPPLTMSDEIANEGLDKFIELFSSLA